MSKESEARPEASGTDDDPVLFTSSVSTGVLVANIATGVLLCSVVGGAFGTVVAGSDYGATAGVLIALLGPLWGAGRRGEIKPVRIERVEGRVAIRVIKRFGSELVFDKNALKSVGIEVEGEPDAAQFAWVRFDPKEGPSILARLDTVPQVLFVARAVAVLLDLPEPAVPENAQPDFDDSEEPESPAAADSESKPTSPASEEKSAPTSATGAEKPAEKPAESSAST